MDEKWKARFECEKELGYPYIYTYIHKYITYTYIHIYIPSEWNHGTTSKDFFTLGPMVIYIYIYIYNHGTKCKEIFTLGPMVSFRGARKLGSYLVRAKLYPIERSLGSFKCNGKRCQVCLNVTETKPFSSTLLRKSI